MLSRDKEQVTSQPKLSGCESVTYFTAYLKIWQRMNTKKYKEQHRYLVAAEPPDPKKVFNLIRIYFRHAGYFILTDTNYNKKTILTRILFTTFLLDGHFFQNGHYFC